MERVTPEATRYSRSSAALAMLPAAATAKNARRWRRLMARALPITLSCWFAGVISILGVNPIDKKV
jgi:hypothetical protein